MVNFWGALFVRGGGDIFSYYFLVIMFRFLKKLGLRGAKFFTATKFNFFFKNRAFFDNILLLAILYEMGFMLFGGLPDSKRLLRPAPSRKKEK